MKGENDEQSADDAHEPVSEDDPQMQLEQAANLRMLNQAIARLPVEFREVVILRELEDLSYKDIAQVVDIPIGTVMSRLAPARKLLRESALVQSTRGNKIGANKNDLQRVANL